ncbi:reverse transcriptase domain-containing protein [Leptospira sp. WS60.C2]
MTNRNPHFFTKKSRIISNNPAYQKAIETYAIKLISQGLPPILSLKDIGYLTNTSNDFIKKIVQRNIDCYKKFTIRKKSGGLRWIYIPNSQLNSVQYWIKKNILSTRQPHFASQAYTKGNSVKKNASIHCNAEWMVKIDIKNFFESISELKVYKVFLNLGYSKFVSFCLARICTVQIKSKERLNSKRWKYQRTRNELILGSLPQGTVTSPLLSNLCAFDLDTRCSIIASQYNFIYSRYSDDLIFTSVVKDKKNALYLMREVFESLISLGYTPNYKKTSLVHSGNRKIVTGLVVNSDHPTLPKNFKIYIKNSLYYCKIYGPLEHCKRIGFKSVLSFRQHLKGKILFAKSIDPKLGASFESDYLKIIWPDT